MGVRGMLRGIADAIAGRAGKAGAKAAEKKGGKAAARGAARGGGKKAAAAAAAGAGAGYYFGSGGKFPNPFGGLGDAFGDFGKDLFGDWRLMAAVALLIVAFVMGGK